MIGTWLQRGLKAARIGKKEVGIAILLVFLCTTVGIINPKFVSAVNIRNLSELIGIYGIFSIGAGMVIITGGIDLSVGSAFALHGVLLSIMLVNWRIPWPAAVGLSILFLCMIGLLHALLIAKLKLQAFIVTLCGLLVYRGLARVIANDVTLGFFLPGKAHSFAALHYLAQGEVGPIKMPFVIMFVVAIVMWIVLHRSVYGRYLFAVGRNEEAARYSGINTTLVIGSAYVLCMALAAVSSVLFAFYVESVEPTEHGMLFELYAIAAAVLGGCSLRGGEGSIIGIVLGTVLLLVLRNQVNLLSIPSSYDWVVTGGVIGVAVVVDSLLSRWAQARRRRVRISPQTPAVSSPVAGAALDQPQ
jgi:ribose transport system permease protein